jgi:hypothetical protein
VAYMAGRMVGALTGGRHRAGELGDFTLTLGLPRGLVRIRCWS